MKRLNSAIFLTIALLYASAAAQTSVFTYQGKLTDGGVPANGSYDLRFRLFDAPSGGNQINGIDLHLTNVQTVSGIFSVNLDFGTASFSGADRFLEIAVSPAGQNNFTTLAPRQRLTSAPYSIQSLSASNAFNLGGIAANQYVLTTDPRLDANSYVQNTTVQQSTVNFNIGGTGTANILNAATQFNLNGSRFLSTPGTNSLFAGIGAGANSVNTLGNTFVGAAAGFDNVSGILNAYFGNSAGRHTTAGGNSFFGSAAGSENTTGNLNSFFGLSAGRFNTTGTHNTFIGENTGLVDDTTPQVNHSTAIGADARVSTSNTVVIGTVADTTRIPGKTILSGKVLINGAGGAVGGGDAEFFNTGSLEGIFTGNVVLYQFNSPLLPSSIHVCGIATTVGSGFGGTALTRCSSPFSSVNDKTDVKPFSGGLDIISRLNPVAFKWKTGGAGEFGLNAEDVFQIAPALVTRNEKGEIEDVSESGLNVLLINAVKEQQKQIEAQTAQIKALRELICASNRTAEICGANR